MAQGSPPSEGPEFSGHEVFSRIRISPDSPFFVRLDGRRFRRVSEEVGADKPFDEWFARCLTAVARALFQNGLGPDLVYVASDELNVLFSHAAPFRGRVEKIDSVLSGVASSAFSLALLEAFGRGLVAAFDSRVVPSSLEGVPEYLAWRQGEAWRNHNNAYAYWLLRGKGHSSAEAAEALRGLKAEGIHDLLFQHGVNLGETPVWQRRGILVFREPYRKPVEGGMVDRRRVREDWDLPLFSSREGGALVQRILDWARPKEG